MEYVPFDFAALPPPLAHGLLLGGEGRPHLGWLAGMALRLAQTSTPDVLQPEAPASAPASVAALGLDLLLAAWEAAPLDGSLARPLLELDRRAGFLARPVRQALRVLGQAWRPPADVTPLATLSAHRRHGDLLAWLLDGLAREPDNLFWRQHALDLALLLDERGASGRVLALDWPEPLRGASQRLEADRLHLAGDLEAAAARYAQDDLTRPSRRRLAHCLWSLGRTDRAEGLWREALALQPWNVNLLCRLHDRLTGRDLPASSGLSGRTAVCLYTCGKARELAATLESLAASELDGAHLYVLDNGSPGLEVESVIRDFAARLPGRLTGIRLAANVGAPAARNWLARHEQVRACDFVAFLDDDALVPPDWSVRFAAAVAALPSAGQWGVKVADLAHPARMQTTEVNLLEDAPDGDPAFSSLCTQDLDHGQFDHVRPCLAVTGCFHLYRGTELARVGDFDIRFSPTQYDDLDHCLRQARDGRIAACTGHLRVRHARLSGALLHQDGPATGVSRGNLMKLSAKHPPEARAALRELSVRMLLGDARTKARVVAGQG